MKNGLLRVVFNMTLERYTEILEDSTNENIFGVLTHNIVKTNQQYCDEFPNAHFILFKRDNEKIKTGFNTILLLKGYDLIYFNENPLRSEGIVKIIEGSLNHLRTIRKTWIKEALS